MLRKFFAYYPTNLSLVVKVAALSPHNANSFQAACKANKLICEEISEERARRLVEGFLGFGAGCYTKRSRFPLSEAEKRNGAMQEQALVAKIVGGLYYGEEPMLLEPMKELVEA